MIPPRVPSICDTATLCHCRSSIQNSVKWGRDSVGDVQRWWCCHCSATWRGLLRRYQRAAGSTHACWSVCCVLGCRSSTPLPQAASSMSSPKTKAQLMNSCLRCSILSEYCWLTPDVLSIFSALFRSVGTSPKCRALQRVEARRHDFRSAAQAAAFQLCVFTPIMVLVVSIRVSA